MPNYYLKDNNGALKVEYKDTNNLFELIKHSNKSYSLKSVTSNLAVTVNPDKSLTLTTYDENNDNQQFLFERMENSLFIESSAKYSEDGRFIKSVKDSIGNIATYDVNKTNGLINTITNPNGDTINYTYDDKLRITNIKQGTHNVDYEYDSNNNLSKIKHGTKNYIFNYDEFNNTSSIQINNTTLVNNTYEANNGNLSKVKYGNNHEISYTYDEFDRIKTITKSNDKYTNYYDNLGRITKLTSNNDTYNYEYDFAKRLSKFKYNDYITEYDYNKDSKVCKKIEKLAKNIFTYNFTYNNESVLTNLNILNNNFNYKYDDLGRLTEHNINNQYKTKYSYITRGNKTSTQVDKVNDNGTEYSYIYNKLDNITEIKKDNIVTNKYYYDEHSQLIKEDDLVNNKTIEYSYDNYGNILSKKTYTYNTTTLLDEDKYEYNDSNWQDLLTKFNNESITYDDIGNPTSIGNKRLTWMNGRELASYTDETNTITYKYNADGIRTSKIVNGLETKYYLEGRTIIFENRNNNVIYYIYNEDELLGFKYNSNLYYYHKNIFGDIIGILDSNYNELVTYEYDSFGNIISITDNSNINLGTINPFRYRSYYYDEDTNLYYLNSRYYNPQIGRFINADENLGSKEKNLSYNNFQYSFNNPINLIDDDGEWPKWVKESVKKVAIGTAVIAATAVVSVATGGAALPVIATGFKTAAAIGAISAATSATISVGESILKSDDFKTTTKKAIQASAEGLGNGFLAGSISSSFSSLKLIRGNGIKIGKTKKSNYGRVTLWYEYNNGGTLFGISDKNGTSKFRIDFDTNNGPHLHYKTKTHGIGREDANAYKKLCGIVAGVVERIFNFFK